ncbi:dipeptidyl peptidase 2 isoform X2 [Patella vulgata]|uniref:dipeptidyl peptidase 2 isoform X2 n=1 Tax=Patella vulgata TaxID=6465 RepID=UPI00217F6C4A|nr:dipeptidyl peptidase 2 isoform X2 [Patella vulgata]
MELCVYADNMKFVVMKSISHILLIGLTFSCVQSDVPYKEQYFDQTIDHFNFVSYGQQTFKQRYLLQDKWFDAVNKGPIFFYTGNEGPITGFWNNTGFVFDIAPQFGALVVFAEHRFYGKSLPFGDDSFKGNNIGLLTIEQALADYAVLINKIKQTYKAKKSAVITFGGSYGGMLSAYMRFKYPNLVDGAIAASAPIYLMSNVIDPSQFFVRVTADFKQSNPVCSANIRKAFTTMKSMASSGQAGLKTLSEKFRLCSQLNETGYNHMVGWIRNAFVSLAMFDYPYPTNFESEIPAFPVDKSCGFMVNATDTVTGLAQITDILSSSNIVFSNGGKDPWAFAGVLHNLSANLTSVIIPDGGHHLDLRGHNVNDPPDVFKARELEKYNIRLWINTAFLRNKNN